MNKINRYTVLAAVGCGTLALAASWLTPDAALDQPFHAGSSTANQSPATQPQQTRGTASLTALTGGFKTSPAPADAELASQASESLIDASGWIESVSNLDVEHISDGEEDTVVDPEDIPDEVIEGEEAAGGGGGGGDDLPGGPIGSDGHEIMGILVFDPDQTRVSGGSSGSNPGFGGRNPEIISPGIGGSVPVSGGSSTGGQATSPQSFAIAAVPEPTSALMAAIGSLAFIRRRRAN